MALIETARSPRLYPIVDRVARTLGSLGVQERAGAPAVARVVQELGVKRVIQAYWTAFEVNVPGNSIGLHLEVPAPKVRWAECYLSPEYQNWVLCFHERDDGEMQLSYYRDYATPAEAIDGFVELADWYVLVPSDLKWTDVALEVDESLGWSEHLRTIAGPSTSAAVSESLKKSTIMWLRYRDGTQERTLPVWFLYDAKANKVFVLSGERQQTLPGAERIRDATMILRWKGKNSQVAEVDADVRVLEHGAEWDEAAERIAEKRLNIPGLPEDTAKRWRDECHILELTPRG